MAIADMADYIIRMKDGKIRECEANPRKIKAEELNF
jgi:hypothetical protein